MMQTSVFDPRRKVDLDPYGPNPLAEDMKGSPAYAAALKGGPPPKMFQGGNADLPAFTASGIDPQMLMRLPYAQRHAAAAEPDPAVVHSQFENYSHMPDYQAPHEGLAEAIRRVSTWASTSGIDPARDKQDALERNADARRVADLKGLSPQRLAAVHKQVVHSGPDW